MPNNTTIQSKNEVNLKIGSVTIPAHVFANEDLHTSLLAPAAFTQQKCEVGLTNTEATITDESGKVVLKAVKKPEEKLWKIDLSKINSQGNNIIRHELNAQIVDYYRTALGNPTQSTLEKATRRGYLSTLTQLTAKMVRANPSTTEATAKGHLNQTRKNLRSTTKVQGKHKVGKGEKPVPQPEEEPDEVYEDTGDYAIVKTFDDINHSDATGQFPVESKAGNKYLMVSTYKNYVYSIPMPRRTGPEYVKAYTTLYAHYATMGIKPTLQRLDNETSGALTNYMATQGTTMQYVPPDNHRANAAERAIQDAKNYVIATLSSTPKEFPLNLWDEAVPQINITMNLLRPYGPDASMSAYEGVHKKTYDFRAHPIAPFGMRVLIHDKATVRKSWDTHGTPGYYLSPALLHYRCYNTFSIDTQTKRITDTVEWLPEKFKMPGSSSTEILTAAIQDVRNAFQSIIDHKLHDEGRTTEEMQKTQQSLTTALSEVTNMFHPTGHTAVQEQRVHTPNTEDTARIEKILDDIVHNTVQEERVPAPNTAREERVVTHATHTHEAHAEDMAHEDQGTLTQHETTDRQHTHAPSGTQEVRPNSISQDTAALKRVNWANMPNISDRMQEELKDCIEKNILTEEDIDKWIANEHRNSMGTGQANMIHQVHRDKNHHFDIPPGANTGTTHYSNMTLNLDEQGKKLTIHTAKRGSNKPNWEIAEEEEFDRLIGTETTRPIWPKDQPMDRRKDTTYYNPQTKETINDESKKTYRVRGTIGGDKINYPGEVSAQTANMESVKILVQGVLHDRHVKKQSETEFITLDIKDYYLGAPLDRPEYVRIHRKFIPQKTIDKYNLEQYMHNDSVLFEVTKCMYGLPQAGYLSQVRLIKHLKKHGYTQHEHVNCLFQHKDNGVSFTLVVDDFGVKIPNRKAAWHLINSLQEMYKLHIDWEGKKYLGFHIHFNHRAQHVVMDMPKYVEHLKAQFHPNTTPAGKGSPAVYQAPNIGKQSQKPTPEDSSEPLEQQDITRVQKIVGGCLYYARAVDATIVQAINAVSSEQANPTQKVLKDAERILQYLYRYPNNKLVYHASDMILHTHSDASYLSRSRARSVGGGLHYLGWRDQPDRINGPLLATTFIIPVVCQAVMEAEYGASFHNGKIIARLRTNLEAMGYQQPATPLQVDNLCAVGIANDTLAARKSKSIDMNFHWIRDRVRQKQINVYWKPGAGNLADFFTKPLPVHKHKELMKNLVRISPEHRVNAVQKIMQALLLTG
jgi:hypothetical protein